MYVNIKVNGRPGLEGVKEARAAVSRGIDFLMQRKANPGQDFQKNNQHIALRLYVGERVMAGHIFSPERESPAAFNEKWELILPTSGNSHSAIDDCIGYMNCIRRHLFNWMKDMEAAGNGTPPILLLSDSYDKEVAETIDAWSDGAFKVWYQTAYENVIIQELATI